MNESEHAVLRHTLGVDSDGILLTDEHRAKRKEEIDGLMNQQRALAAEREELDRAMDGLHGDDRNGSNQRRNQIESQMNRIREEIHRKTSTDYPALPDEA